MILKIVLPSASMTIQNKSDNAAFGFSQAEAHFKIPENVPAFDFWTVDFANWIFGYYSMQF